MNAMDLIEREIKAVSADLGRHGYDVNNLFEVTRNDDDKTCDCLTGKDCGRAVGRLKTKLVNLVKEQKKQERFKQ